MTATRTSVRVDGQFASRVHWHMLQGESFTEYYMTASTLPIVAGRSASGSDTSPGSLADSEHTVSPEELLAGVAAVMASHHIQPVAEKLFGRGQAREEILRLRHDVYTRHGLDPSTPVTWVEGRPVDGGDFAGLQLWGLAAREGRDLEVTTVGSDTPARYWRTPGCRFLYLPAVRGTMPASSSAAEAGDGPTLQAERMFVHANRALVENGFRYAQVVRTWIYMARILDWYDGFNRVRSEHHARAGLSSDGTGPVMPASTGIQGKNLDEECFMDVLAMDVLEGGMGARTPLRRSRRQDPAADYGSAFSRGMVIRTQPEYETVYVSGTASIDAAGKTIYQGNPEAQAIETLLNVAALLQDRGGGLESICAAVLYCKNEEAWQAYRRVTDLLRTPRFPTVCVLADVCRDDLLLELEAVASI